MACLGFTPYSYRPCRANKPPPACLLPRQAD
jgi:hypothetical protein